MALKLPEMDEHVTYLRQLQEDDGPVVLSNEFNVPPPEDTDRFIAVWADDAAFMKLQPGFISTQPHRGIAGSTTFVNGAVWESAPALGEAFRSHEFQQRAARYPRKSRRYTTCVQERRRSGHLRRLAARVLDGLLPIPIANHGDLVPARPRAVALRPRAVSRSKRWIPARSRISTSKRCTQPSAFDERRG